MVKKPSARSTAARLAPVSSPAPLIIPFSEMAQTQGENFNEWLSAFFARLPEGVILTDQDGRITVFNEAAGAFLGYRPGEVVGHNVFLWDLCKLPAKGSTPGFKRGLETGRSFPEEEVEMTAKNDRQTVFTARVCGLYGKAGELIGAYANLGSLAEHRAAEREQKTMERKVSIGRIVSALAHEINNPLQTLRTSVELGLDARKTYQRRRGYLEAANTEISRISQIIMVLRRFYPSGDAEILSAEVNSSLRIALESLSKDLNEQNISAHLDLAENLPPVRVIAHQLQNIFLTLLQELLATAKPDSSLEIRTCTGQFDTIEITISNTPVPSENAATTDPFDPTAIASREARLVLGLSISRAIILEHGGTLEISVDGHRTFQISLPQA